MLWLASVSYDGQPFPHSGQLGPLPSSGKGCADDKADNSEDFVFQPFIYFLKFRII